MQHRSHFGEAWWEDQVGGTCLDAAAATAPLLAAPQAVGAELQASPLCFRLLALTSQIKLQ
jgi:hypothetical protein